MIQPDTDPPERPGPRWTTDRPTRPGFYFAAPIEHGDDEARMAIHDMAEGWVGDTRPLLLVADVGGDDLEQDDLVPFFAGIGVYPFGDLEHDFACVWWYGPLDLPPAIPGLGPVRPPGEQERRRFRVPRGWPPTE